MLQILRKKAQSTFIQIIVVVIALVFIFWGVGSNLGRDRQSALVVNGEEVSFQEYQQAYDRTYERFSQQFGGNMPKDLAESLGIKQQVINQLVQTSLLRQGAKKMGIYVSAEEVRKVIENMVQFQDNGAFSMDRYKAVLTNIRTAPTKFEKSMRTDRLAELAVREIGNFASVATDSEIQEIYSQLNEKVEVNFVSFKPADFLNQVQISDEALSAWYETVKDNYKTAPEIQLKYFTYTYDKIAAKVEIDDAQIENYYRENTQLFAVPEQRKASHILFKTNANDSEQVLKEKEAKALEVLALAKNGSNFAELAKEYSEGPSRENGGELGYFSQGQMVPTFDDAVFSMEKGAVSEVVKTQFGYHIIYLEDIKPSSIRSLEEAKSQIVATLKEKEAESLAFQVANSAYEGIIAAGGLDQYLAATPDAELQTTPLFKREDAPDDLKKDSIFLDKAFALNKGEFSSLIKGNSGYAIFYVENVKEPETPALATIKDKLVEDFKVAESKKLGKKAADDLLKELRDGGSLSELAAAKGYEIASSGQLGRNSQNDTTAFPVKLLNDAFLLSANNPLPQEVGQDGENYYVYSFTSRTLPKMAENATEVEQYRTSLQDFKQQQLLSAWLRNQQLQAKITRHPSL